MQSSMLRHITEDFGNGGTIDGDVVITGDLQVDGGGSLSFDEIIEGTQVIDVTSTEALLVRKNADGGDVFLVDTTNSNAELTGDMKITNAEATIGLTITQGGDNYALKIVQNDADKAAIFIDAATTTSHVIYIDAPLTTTASTIRLDGLAGLTSGSMFYANITSPNLQTGLSTGAFRIIHSANSTDKESNIMHLHNDNVGSVGVVPLKLQQDSIGQSLSIGVSNAATTAFLDSKGIYLDYDKSGVVADGVTSALYGFDLDIDDAATNHANATVTMTGGRINVASANAQGTLKNVGLDVNVSGADENVAGVFANATSAPCLIVGSTDIDNSTDGWGGMLFGRTNTTATYNKAGIFFQRDGGDGSLRGDLIFAVDGAADSGNATITDAVMTLTHSGSVGIGIDAPTAPLEVYDTGGNHIKITSAAGAWRLVTNNSTGAFELTESGVAVQMTVLEGGNVGIGTATPDGPLHILTPANTHAILKIDTTTSNYNAIIQYAIADTVKVSTGMNLAKGQPAYEIYDNVNSRDMMVLDANSRISLSNNGGVDTTIFGKNAGNAATANVRYSTAIGHYALYTEDNIDAVTAVGYYSLFANNGGTANTAVGYQAGMINVTGANNTSLGYRALKGGTGNNSNNTAIGSSALVAITTGGTNVAIGSSAGVGITTASKCVLLGSYAGDALTVSGAGSDGTVAVGYNALTALTSGHHNMAIGYQAGMTLSSEHYNVFIGYEAGKLSNGSYNTVLGHMAFDAVSSGAADNVAIGNNAMGGAIGAEVVDDCVAVGAEALSGALDSSGTDEASGTVAIGKSALAALTSGAQNTAIGYTALDAENTGSYSTAVGYEALTAQTGGASATKGNTAVGAMAGKGITGGQYNTAVGWGAADTHDTTGGTYLGQACGSNGTGDYCVFVGMGAGETGNNTSTGTVGIGFESLLSLTTGENNVAIGWKAGRAMTTSDGNTIIGHNAYPVGNNADGAGNNTIIGYNAAYQVTNAGFIQNTFVGKQVGGLIIDHAAVKNTGVGHGCFNNLTSGDNNVAIGRGSLGTLTTGSSNTHVGMSTEANASGATNETVVGYATTGQADNSVTLGNASVTAVYMASDKGATVYCDKITVGAGITQHSTTHLDVQGSIRAGCGSGDSGSTASGQLMGLAGSTEGDNTVNLLKASMTSEGSLWVVSGYQVGTSNRFTDLLLAYNAGVAVVSAQNTNSPDTRTYSIVSESLKLLINVTDGGEQTYNIKMTGIGGNELAASTAPTIGGA